MITEEGISAILRSFTSEDRGGYRIATLELGNLITGEDEEVVFSPTHIHTLQSSQIIVIDYKTMRVNVVIDSDDILEGFDVIEYTYMRLVCVNGEVFAWQSFSPRTLGAGLRATVNWEITLVDLVDDMLQKAHIHGGKHALDKLGETEDGLPTYDKDRLNVPKWKGDVW